MAVFLPEGPCYKCVFGDAKSSETCDTEGISTETSTLVSSLAAELALKILRNERPEKNLIRINTGSDEISLIKIRRSSDCPACRGNFEFITGSRISKPIRLCGAEHYQIRGEFDFEGLRKVLAARKDFQDFGQCFKSGKLTVFNDNRALVRAGTEEEARAIYSKIIGN